MVDGVVERTGLRRFLPKPPARGYHQPDYWFIAIILCLVMFGTVMVFSASFAIGLEEGNGYYYLTRQILWLFIGLAGMLLTYHIDYHHWRRFSLIALVGVMVMLAAVIVIPGGGMEVYGARRWIPLGPLAFQPSEVAKPILIIYLANWLGQKGPKVKRWDYGLIPFAAVLGAMVFLLMREPDLGTSILLAVIGVSMFLVAGANLLQLGALSGIGTSAFLALALASSYRRERLLVFLNPAGDLRNLAWQLQQARLALGSGGIFGLGLGESRQKFLWLPFAQNDSIFAVIGEELGLIGCALVILMFLALAWRGFQIARRAPDTFGALVAVGIVSWMIFQAAINIGGITSTIPFTGIPLPFISYGGTALAVSMAAIGILLNISRQTLTDQEQTALELELSELTEPEPARASTGGPVWGPGREPLARPVAARRRLPVQSLDGPARARSGAFGRVGRRHVPTSISFDGDE